MVAISAEENGKASVEWSLERMRPRTSSRKPGALERENVSAENCFIKCYSKEEQRGKLVAGGECGIKQIFFLISFLFCFCF